MIVPGARLLIPGPLFKALFHHGRPADFSVIRDVMNAVMPAKAQARTDLS
jgi:hypothetical protein